MSYSLHHEVLYMFLFSVCFKKKLFFVCLLLFFTEDINYEFHTFLVLVVVCLLLLILRLFLAVNSGRHT